jgi:hypothetical protein
VAHPKAEQKARELQAKETTAATVLVQPHNLRVVVVAVKAQSVEMSAQQAVLVVQVLPQPLAVQASFMARVVVADTSTLQVQPLQTLVSVEPTQGQAVSHPTQHQSSQQQQEQQTAVVAVAVADGLAAATMFQVQVDQE